jgi:uncharacterized Tic20 family protein
LKRSIFVASILVGVVVLLGLLLGPFASWSDLWSRTGDDYGVLSYLTITTHYQPGRAGDPNAIIGREVTWHWAGLVKTLALSLVVVLLGYLAIWKTKKSVRQRRGAGLPD